MSVHETVKPGDLYIYKVPFVDGTQSKPRPVLIISTPNSKGDVQGIPGSAQIANWSESHQIVLKPDDLSEGVLSDVSVFPISKQMVLSPRFFAAKIGTVKNSVLEEALRGTTSFQVKQFQAAIRKPAAFIPGKTVIPAAGKVIGEEEIQNMVEASLDGWLTTGRFNDAFEKKLAKFLGVKYVLTTNSGSSANLLAFTALTSPSLGLRALQPGDEVISVAAGFPTTVNPIIQNGCIPVFVDVDIPTYNIDASKIEEALSDRTRAIMLAHTLGNPFNLKVITDICKKHRLWLIEDCCDALGATYTMPSDSSPSPPRGGPGRGGSPSHHHHPKQTPTRRHLRRHRHPQFLPRTSHHHGRGRRNIYQQSRTKTHHRIIPRLGP